MFKKSINTFLLLTVYMIFLSVNSFGADTISLTGTLRDFNQNHIDFERHANWENGLYPYPYKFYDGVKGGLEKGNVLSQLGTDHKPRVNSQSTNNFRPRRLEDWYNDVDGVNMAMPYTITLSETSPGSGVYFYSNDNFFPADGKLFGKENYHGRTDPKKYPEYQHNFHMTYELHTKFTYHEGSGQVFNFAGDDDVWAFINNKLAIDLGGIHSVESDTVNLDDKKNELGLVDGKTYRLDFFWAERHTEASRFAITTSIQLATLIADYHFDECQYKGIDNEVKDYSGNNNHGTIDGNLSLEASNIINRDVNFTNGKMTFNIPQVDTSDDAETTVSMWLNFKNRNSMPLSWGNNNYNLYMRSTGQFGFNTWNHETYGVNNLSLDNWHHIVAVFHNGDVKKCKLYIDGQKKNIGYQNRHRSTSNTVVSHTLYIGSPNGTYHYALQGMIDELKVYNGALNDTQVKNIYDNEKNHKNFDGTNRQEIICQVPFSCNGAMFLSNASNLGTASNQDSSNGMFLHLLDVKQDPISFQTISKNGYADTYNALAYNPKDNFLYATYGNKLLRIDSNATVQELGVIDGLADSQRYAGTFDTDGYYYLAKDGDDGITDTIFKIDLDTKSVIERIQLSEGLSFWDMTYDKNKNVLYMFDRKRVENGYQIQLVKVSLRMSNGKYPVTRIGEPVTYESDADVMYLDKNSDKYVYLLTRNSGIYQVNVDDGTRHLVSDTQPLAYLNDAAMCPNATADLPAKLIVDYHFDACDYNGTDGEVKDYSGSNHNGTVLFGDTTSDSGQVKRSIKFQKGRIYVGGISEFDKNNFSISFWTKINGSSSTNKQTLLDKTNEIKITYFENDKTLHIRAYKKGKPAIFKTDELNIGDNNWHHIVLIKDGDVPTLYIDDQNKSFSTWYWSSSTSQGKSGDLTIGGENKKDNTTSSADQSHANIDEVKLYNGVLTKDEIDDIYMNEKAGKNYDGSARETQECAIPFECKSNSYLIKSETSDALSSSVMRFNLIRGTVDESVDNVGTYNINAVGFNPKDGFMYGWSAEKEGWGSYHRPNAHIVKIDSHYHTYEVPLKNEIPDSKMRFFLGDISKDGIFYFANMGAEKAADGNYKKYYLETIRVVDLTDRRALDTIKIKYPSGVRHIQNADFAINPIDDQLYTVNSKNNQLVRIIISSSDPSKIGMVEELGEIYPIKKYPNETISGRYDPKLSGLYVWEDEGDILTWDNKTIRAYRKFPGDSFYTRFNQFDTYSVYSYFDKFGYYYLQIKDKVYKVNISHPWQGHDKNKARAIEFSALKFDTSGDGARCALAPVGDHPLVMIKNATVKEGTGETKMMKFHLDSDRNISRADLSCSIHLINGEANRDDFAPWLDHYAFKLSNIDVDKGYELEIPIAGDHQPEREESFILHCDSPDLIFVKASDHNATGTIIDDDINKIDAWDIDTIKRLKTKIVNHHTTIRIHQVDAQGEPTNTTNSEDMNRTRYRIVDMDDAGHLCGMEAKDLSYDDFNQSFVFDNSGKADITLIVDHAIKRAKLQFLWLDRNGTKQTSCSSDMFAVRPDHFVLNLPSTLKAGHDFNITIEAQDENNHRVLGYQEREGDSFQIDVNDTNPTKCALDSSFTLSGVEIPQTVTKKYNEAGNVRIKIYEKRNGKEFANVDENDTGISDEQLLIHKAEKTIAVRPDHFKVTTQLTNIYGTSEVNKYAVISNHVSSSPTLTISVEAQTESNQSIKNYYDECAAEDVIVVPGLYVHSDDNGNNQSKLLVAEDINDSISTPNVNDVTESPYQCPDHLPVDSAREGINQMEHLFGDIAESYTLNKTMFKKENNGKGSKILRLNFFRNKSIPMNPINVQFNSVYVQDGKNSDVFGLATLNKSVTYLYMRTFIEPALEVVGKRDLDAKVYYEAYEPGALGRRSVSGEDGWRIIDYNPHIPTMKFGIDSIKYSGRIDVTKTDSSTLHIHANNLPESNEVQLSRDDDFKYVTDTIKTHVTFTPDSANWAGKGNAGRTIDNNISTIRQFKRISW